MTYQKRRLLNEMFQKAIKEEINACGFAIPDLIEPLKRAQHALCEAGLRILDDPGRAKRLFALCKVRKPKA